MLEYQITATVEQGQTATVKANQTQIHFDASSGRDEILPNPAELLLSSLAACLLKNLQRYAEILHLSYKRAQVTVHGYRTENPPKIYRIVYSLEVNTEVTDHQLQNWHKNIRKFGTITNTLVKACEVEGVMIKNENI